ncbi:hypothetical protein B484DRAFT_421733, partial [Ochromonadaceae sp. CCMP2298]
SSGADPCARPPTTLQPCGDQQQHRRRPLRSPPYSPKSTVSSSASADPCARPPTTLQPSGEQQQ